MSATYRVSAKALIFNQQGDVLLVKEHYDDWNLPGGGVDHGETPQQAIKRELQEEIGLSLEVAGPPLRTVNFYHQALNRWVMWLVFKLDVEDTDSIHPGEDVSDVRFAKVNELGDACEEQVVADILSE